MSLSLKLSKYKPRPCLILFTKTLAHYYILSILTIHPREGLHILLVENC